MQSVSVFLDITKFVDFMSKNADISRRQGMSHVIHIFLGSSITVPSFIIIGYVRQILGRGPF